MSAPIRLLLADDHSATRAGVRLALEDAGFAVCAEAADADGAVDAARRHRPALCLLDVHMPGDGITAAQRIAEEVPETTVVMLTVSTDDADLLAALRAGAAGYLLKDTDPERLPYALRGALAGEAALPRTLVARLVHEFHGRERRRGLRRLRERGERLTEREWEVVDLLREGLGTAAMAGRLGVSHVTVRRHVSGIVRKLGARNRDEARRLLEGND